MSAEEGIGSGRVTYTTKEILDGINEKLARAAANAEQQERRLTMVENRLEEHDKILTTQLPKLVQVIDDLNVREQVEAALDAKHVRGISNRDRIVVGALSACILLVTIISNIPHLTHG